MSQPPTQPEDSESPPVLSAVRHSTSGSNPWCIKDDKGRQWAAPGHWFEHPTLGKTWVHQGALFFRRKMDANDEIVLLEKAIARGDKS